MIDAIAAGHLCVDIIPTIMDAASGTSDNFLAPGSLTEVGAALLSTGGSVSNAGLALRKLGLEVRLLAKIGDDFVGNLTRDILGSHDPRLASELTIGRGEPSSYTVVISIPGIDRSFLHCPGTNNTFGPEDVPPALLRQARLFHFGYPPLMRRMFADGGAALSTIMRRAKDEGVTTSLDMAMPDPNQPSGRADWEGILARTCPFVDIFMPSVEELMYMLDREHLETLRHLVGQTHLIDALVPEDVAALSEKVLALGARVVAIKMGHRGLYLRTQPLRTRASAAIEGRGGPDDPEAWADRELWIPCFQVNVVNTVGSGDATIAGFLAAVLRGQSPEEAATSAVAVGACNVEAPDTISGIQSWETTQERIRRGWPKLEAKVQAPGWRWNAGYGLWHGPNDRAAL
jgi:sugar/nucleoside kinase (ribokinase family)